MNTQEITTLGGKIIFDEISNLGNSEISLITDHLKEDLFRASFPSGQILDIEWYPELSEKGSFKILLIAKSDWESPSYSRTATTWAGLEEALKSTFKKSYLITQILLHVPKPPLSNFFQALPRVIWSDTN